jgi:phosphatidylglycerophosphate synthase
VTVNIWGKVKTIVQDVMIFCLMINQRFLDLPMKEVGWLCAWAALGLSLWSAWLYGSEFWLKAKHRMS